MSHTQTTRHRLLFRVQTQRKVSPLLQPWSLRSQRNLQGQRSVRGQQGAAPFLGSLQRLKHCRYRAGSRRKDRKENKKTFVRACTHSSPPECQGARTISLMGLSCHFDRTVPSKIHHVHVEDRSVQLAHILRLDQQPPLSQKHAPHVAGPQIRVAKGD